MNPSASLLGGLFRSVESGWALLDFRDSLLRVPDQRHKMCHDFSSWGRGGHYALPIAGVKFARDSICCRISQERVFQHPQTIALTTGPLKKWSPLTTTRSAPAQHEL